ncbi:hypothetical protein [Cypionkella sp.]|uniref:hypothetical protein n=1 Tax=Cypionkella sp. TaxID=2811411 RepID=UPI003753DFE1
MDRLTRDEQRQVEEHAAKMSAEQRAQTAAQIEESVRMGMAVQTPQEWDAMMTAQGRQDLVGQFNSRQAIAAKYMTMADVIKMANPEQPDPTKGAPQGYAWADPANHAAGVKPLAGYEATPDEYMKYVMEEASAGRKPLSRLEYSQAKAGKGFSVTTADGTTVQYGGAAGSNVEAKAAGNRQISTDIIIGAADKARQLIGMMSTGLIGKAAAYNPQSDAAELNRQVDVLKANAKVENLQAMRDASKTGGALGAVSDSENAMLAAKAGALDPASGAERFQAQLDDYEHTLLRIVHGPSEGDRIFSASRGGAYGQGSQQQSAPQSPALSPEIEDLLKKYPAAGN